MKQKYPYRTVSSEELNGNIPLVCLALIPTLLVILFSGTVVLFS